MLAASCAAALWLSACGDGGADTNLLLITLDTTRADRLGAYGHPQARTPVLDDLAARGALFEQAYSPSPMTLPAHASMMTGLMPPEHGARVNGLHRLADDVPTLAEQLLAHGFETGAFVAAFVLESRFGLARGFEHYDDELGGAYEQEVPQQLSIYRPADRVVEPALDWLEERGEARFFLWVHLYDAHSPWHAHGAAEESATYDGELAFVDEQVGRLLDGLRELGLAGDTLVVALGDHGEGLGDHGEMEHGYLLDEEVLRVPWIVAGPGVDAGRRVPALVSISDLAPTVLELLDLREGWTSGRSLAPGLRGQELPSAECYAETELPWTGYRWAPQFSLTSERWKYVRTPQRELYDRRVDRRERANLADVRPEVCAELDSRLSAIQRSFAVRAPGRAALDSGDLEHLAALGYAASGEATAPASLDGLADVKQRLELKELSGRLRRGLATGTIDPLERLEIADELAGSSPETPAFHLELGEALVELGRIEEALPPLEEALALAPNDPRAHYTLGDACQRLGRQSDARRHLEAALEIEPGIPAAHVGMGNVLRAEGRPDLAAGWYAEALRLRPDYPEAHFDLALSLLDRGMREPAIESLSAALRARPGWALAHACMGSTLLRSGRPEQAVDHFRAALERQPGIADWHNDAGVALQELRRSDEARLHFEKARELQPEFFRPLVNLGNLAFEEGDDDEALERYEEAVRIAPELVEPRMRLAHFLATTPRSDLRDGQRAVELATTASMEATGRQAPVLDTLAAAHAAAGRFPEAVSAARLARKAALLDGDEELARAVEQRIELYEREEPFTISRADSGTLPWDDAD